MKLEICGVEYDYQRAKDKAKLTDLADLKIASGIGVRSINKALFRLGDLALIEDPKEQREASEALSEEPDVLIAMQALVFLCRRHGGDKVTFDESAVSYSDLRWVIEDGDLPKEEDADPTQASGDQTPPSDETASAPARKLKASAKKPSTPR